MKKFVFQLDSLYSVKKTQKKRLQKEYSEAETLHGNAVKKKECLEKIIESENEKYEARVKNGMTVGEMRANNVFFEDLRNQQKTAVTDEEQARAFAECKKQELLGVFSEIKALEKLREKQYEAYLAEEGKREASRLEDILSFKISDKNANIGKA